MNAARRIGWLAVMLAHLGGCDTSSGRKRTSVDDGLPAARCSVASVQGQCVAPLAHLDRWIFETSMPNTLLPFPSADQRIVQRFALDVSALQGFLPPSSVDLGVTIPAPILIAGRVRRSSTDNSTVLAKIDFVSQRRVGDLSAAQVSTTSQGSLIPVEGEPLDYAVVLTSGQAYHVKVQPLVNFSSEVPPLYFDLDLSGSQYTDGSKSVIRRDIVFAAKADALKGRLSDARRQPLQGFRVFVLDADERVVSTVETIDSASANFELLLTPQSTPKRLRFEPIEDKTSRDNYDSFSVALADLVVNSEKEVVVLAPEARATMRWAGTVSDPAGNGVANALIRFQSHLDPAAAPRLAQTNQQGSFAANMPTGDYTMTVTPTEASGLATLVVESITVSKNQDGQPIDQVFRLAERIVYQGSINGIKKPIRGVWTPVLDTRVQRSAETVTDAQSNFSIRLDPGPYDMVLGSDMNKDWPNFIWANAKFSDDGSGVPNPLRIEPTQGSAVRISVRDFRANLIPNLTLKAYFAYGNKAQARWLPLFQQKIGVEDSVELRVPDAIFEQVIP